MAGNMSIMAYAELSVCVPSNCKQMLCWAHMSPILTSSVAGNVWLDLPLLWASVDICLSFSLSLTLYAHIQNPQLLLNWGLHSSAVKWGKYRLPWGYNDTQGACKLRWQDRVCELVGSGSKGPGCVSFTLCPMHNRMLKYTVWLWL